MGTTADFPTRDKCTVNGSQQGDKSSSSTGATDRYDVGHPHSSRPPWGEVWERAGGSQYDSDGDESYDYDLLCLIIALLPAEPSVSSDAIYLWADGNSLSSSSASKSGIFLSWYSDEMPAPIWMDQRSLPSD